MAIAFHVTFGAYGFWLPNDPRGSWSKYVYAERLRIYGGATKIHTRQSVARINHDHARRSAAKKLLKYPPVVFAARQIEAIGRGFCIAIKETGLQVFACAVMPNHVHFVYALHKRKNGSLVGQLKSLATKQLNKERLHPFDGAAKVWAEGYWEVYLDTEDEVANAIEYVNQNPLRDGNGRENWPFLIHADLW